MHLSRLVLRNYRNIESLDIDPDKDFNILWGNNAQGKTNILEAIYLLANLKSFRGSRNEELIRYGNELCQASGEVIASGVRRKIAISVDRHGKKARLDGKTPQSSVEFFGHLRPVLFSPEEVGLMRGSPAGRRGLIDRAIFQCYPNFLSLFQEYGQYLKNRNKCLKEAQRENDIFPWTEGLIRTGSRLRLERIRYIRRLIPLFKEAYQSISEGKEEADIHYPFGETSEQALQEQLRQELARSKEREYRLGQTLAGPHRDDPLFLIDGHPVRLYGSQGQQRSFVLAFKTAQIMDLESILGEPPVLLLDDMTGELDRRRQGYFFRFLLQQKGQVFITTTDIQPLIREGIQGGRFFRVENGNLKQSRCE